MAEKSLAQVMASANKQIADAAAQNRQEFSGNKVGLPPHMSDPSKGGGYVTDSGKSARAKAAESDKDRFGTPTAMMPPRKP